MENFSPTSSAAGSQNHRIEVPPLAWQVGWRFLALLGGLVPLAMAIGIVTWGGLDITIAIPLGVCAAGLVGLVVALVAVRSWKKPFMWIAALSASGIFCVTLLFLVEFLFFRGQDTTLLERVPVFSANVPLVFLYVFSLVSSLIEIFVSALKIRQFNKSEVKPWPR